MSCTFTLSEYSSELSCDFYPPIYLSNDSSYGLALLGFYTYNSIFNVDETNNCFICIIPPKKTQTVYIPPGAYEISDLNRIITDFFKKLSDDTDENVFALHANNNTLKCEVTCNYDIDLNCKNSIANLIGFEQKKYIKKHKHVSTFPVNIMKTRIIRIDCNLTAGAYLNSVASHTIFEFDIDVEPGYKLTKEPKNIIYMPVIPTGRQFIDTITLRILDDNGDLINFRGEKVIVKLELKKLT